MEMTLLAGCVSQPSVNMQQHQIAPQLWLFTSPVFGSDESERAYSRGSIIELELGWTLLWSATVVKTWKETREGGGNGRRGGGAAMTYEQSCRHQEPVIPSCPTSRLQKHPTAPTPHVPVWWLTRMWEMFGDRSLSFLFIDHCMWWPSCHFDPVDIMQQPVDGDFFYLGLFPYPNGGSKDRGCRLLCRL